MHQVSHIVSVYKGEGSARRYQKKAVNNPSEAKAKRTLWTLSGTPERIFAVFSA